MLQTLLESRSNRSRSTTGAIASVTLHTALIAAAIYATAQARVVPTRPSDTVRPIYLPPLPAPQSPVKHPDERLVIVKRLPVVASIDISLPPIPEISLPTSSGEDFHSSQAGAPGTESVGGSGNEISPTYEAGQVEKQVALAPGNSPPRYPDVLRNSGVEGRVVAQFVVDESGLVEKSSVRMIRSDNAIFEAAVRAALERMRFIPAEVGGRKVRQLVQMPFVFTLDR